MSRKRLTPDSEEFEVTVWDHEGNIIKKLWNATRDEMEAVREDYSDDPFKTIEVDLNGH